MEPVSLLLLIAAHLALGGVVGWVMRGGAGREAAAGPSPREACQAAVEEIEYAAAHQGLELTSFEAELECGDFARSTAPGVRVNCLVESNRLLEQRMRSGIERLSHVAAPSLDALRTRIVRSVTDYCGRIGEFCSVLSNSLDEQTPAEATAALLGAVTEMSASNQNLAADLREASRALAPAPDGPQPAPQPVTVDPVTGLPDRDAFRDQHAALHAMLRGSHEGYALVLYGVDHFQPLLDQYGREAADGVLQRFARKLSRVARPGDHLARVGEDVFAVLLPGSGVYEAETTAERVRSQAEQTIGHHLGSGVSYTVSAGVTAAFRGEPTRAALERAQTALRTARQRGGNRVDAEFGIALPADSPA